VTAVSDAVSSFAAAHLKTWRGLPAEVRLADLAPLLGFDPEDLRRGDAGHPNRTRRWVPAEPAEAAGAAGSTTYHGGLRLWLDDETDHVVLVEGLNPVDPDGKPAAAPDLGDPEAIFDAVLGPFHVRDAERVYAARGLALQVNPDNGVLVAVLGFTPTGVDDYRRRLQPHRQPTEPFPYEVLR
jgi:hypothetical protein